MNFYLALLICACCVAGHVVDGRRRARRATGTIGEQLRIILQGETSLRTKLQARVQALKQEAASINTTIVPCNCPNVVPVRPSGPSIAYTGTLPAYMSSLKNTSVLNYTADLINVGQPFNVTSGHFVANLTGLYAFSMAVYMQPAYTADVSLVKNGSPILNARTGHYKASSTDRQVNMGTNFALVQLNIGDEVWPQYKSGSSSNLYADGVTTFSGVLLYEL